MTRRREIALIAAAGGVAGACIFYACDRITFLWGSDVREMRHAGWSA